MRTVLLLGLMAVGLAACGANTTVDATGWSRYDGTPIKGNAALEQKFAYDEDKCQGRDAKLYKYCMASRGYTDEVVPPPAPPVIAAASTDWRARAAEARAVATQLGDPAARKMMAGIADTYDRLARHSEGRSTASLKPAAAR